MADNRVSPFWASYGARAHHDAARPAVFLDRDGVINHNRSDYVKSWKEFVFLPGALEAIARLAASAYAVVVVTNQSAIGRGIIPVAAVDDIHRRMVKRVRSAGGRIDAVSLCPHQPDEGCLCRKPAPGMLREAAGQLSLDLSAAYLVGDAESDMMAAHAAGCCPVLVMSGRTTPEQFVEWGPIRERTVVQPDLEAAVSWILDQRGIADGQVA